MLEPTYEVLHFPSWNLFTKNWQLKRSIPSKWITHLPQTFFPNWKEVWHKARYQKEVAFMWSVWYNMVAVHSWQAQIALVINTWCNFWWQWRNCSTLLLMLESSRSLGLRVIDLVYHLGPLSYCKSIHTPWLCSLCFWIINLQEISRRLNHLVHTQRLFTQAHVGLHNNRVFSQTG